MNKKPWEPKTWRPKRYPTQDKYDHSKWKECLAGKCPNKLIDEDSSTWNDRFMCAIKCLGNHVTESIKKELLEP